MAEPTHIVVRNARTHNLRGVDVDVPRDALVVFTGVSGSGKSSLVYDTIYQEGQRRFMESLSSYARQFLGQMERPEVDAVEGVSPTLSIDQKTVNRNPRSTVGTVTEILDHLRLLYARLGEPHCPICDTPIEGVGVDHVVDEVIARGAGRRVHVLGPVVKDRKGEYRKEMEALHRDGWVRARVDGALIRLDEPPTLERYKKHTLEVVVDRLVPSTADRARVAEAVETALRLGEGTCTVLVEDEVHTFSTARACPNHPDVNVPELEPRLFSFNSTQGACPTCQGLGVLEDFDPDRLVDWDAPVATCFRALNDDGRLPFSRLDGVALEQVARDLGADPRTPVGRWSAAKREALLHGDADIHWRGAAKEGPGRDKRARVWTGLLGAVERVWHYTKFPKLAPFRTSQRCPDCKGARLGPIPRAVTFAGRSLPDLNRMTLGALQDHFEGVHLEGEAREIGALLVSEIQGRLHFLVDVGLSYLSLDRSAATLSGGESQRIRLASQVGSGLQGVTYVLDEPSIGLHPRDNQRLLGAIRALRDRGNSVLVVEHDVETIRAADHVVDVGPGAGREGGHVLASGSVADLLASDGLTARYLRGDLRVARPATRRPGTGEHLVVRGAHLNNLQDVDLHVPLGTFVAVTGVSGSGKSSLTFQALERSLVSALSGDGTPVGCQALEGVQHVDKVVRIDQKPIGRTPRSNPATYTGAMTVLRELFAATAEARARGYTKSRFSFNVKGGRCEDCQGAGVKTVEMQFLPDVQVPCETCGGLRFNRETLDVTYQGLTISEVLDLPIAEALGRFGDIPKLARILQTLVDVGLDYVTLGQPSTTLSGGEAQRMKLASELHRPATGSTVYLLDEPTTGLHLHDVSKLLIALQRLVDQGNTVLVVEHHTDVILAADHVVDLGPEGGSGGGRIVATGTPEHHATLDTPTGRALQETLAVEQAPLLVAEAAEAALAPRSSLPRAIVVEGARKHNLQDVDVTLPHGELTVITGPSGSGKTSLAFDTIFAEGQRRYVESLSTYARRFLGRLDRAPVERLEGLQPAIAIDQKSASHNPRSTVATVTEIHDVLRLLYARVGQPHCPYCPPGERPLHATSASAVARALAEADPGAGWLLAPLVPDEDPAERRGLLVRDGWQRLAVFEDGVRELRLDEDVATCEAELAAGAWLVVDRLTPSVRGRARVAEAAHTAYHLGHGHLRFVARRTDLDVRFTEGLVCPVHGMILPELTPRHFSFNSRLGMCPRCEGLGTVEQVRPARLFLSDGTFDEALDPRVHALVTRSARTTAVLEAVLAEGGFTRDDAVTRWDADTMATMLHGSDRPLQVTWQRGKQRKKEAVPWPGLLEVLRAAKLGLSWTKQDVPCPDCDGARLDAAPRHVTLAGTTLRDWSAQTVEEAHATVLGWSFEGERAAVVGRVRDELAQRLGFLADVGLGYLTLDRRADSLSGGESQRIRLASQLGSQLTGVTYVLDEPTIGLHPRDTDRLLDSLEGLRDLGNTVLVVEHDPDTIARADHVVDMGPEAGRHGGHVMAQGTPAEVAQVADAPTGRWLSGAETMPPRSARRTARGWIDLEGARTHNLREARVRFPMGVWTCVTGVSGSGKSSLVMDTLAPALKLTLGQEADPGPYRRLTVDGRIDGLVEVDQQPLGRTPRSTPATYVGVMDKLRALFAKTPGANARGWKPGRFSFNSQGGRCETCEGRGATLIEMHFLPDVWITCPTCRGKRFNHETLQVRYKGHSIADVLTMRADEALALFDRHRSIKRSLKALCDVGLGYLQLGQPATTLSGGEAQRVKLASELSSRKGHRVYVLDEPTTGLHLGDVKKLVAVLHALVEAGHTVITIEHHVALIKQCDWVIEMGPEGGTGGGRVIAAGTVEQVVEAGTATGRVLA